MIILDCFHWKGIILDFIILLNIKVSGFIILFLGHTYFKVSFLTPSLPGNLFVFNFLIKFDTSDSRLTGIFSLINFDRSIWLLIIFDVYKFLLLFLIFDR